MPERTLHFDESGYTGYNLLDPVQPVFTVASASIDEGAAEAILRACFPNYQGAEFKFSNIWKTGSKAGLLAFAQALVPLADSTFVYMIDKRFGVLTKIVDFLIEPMVTNAGYDFYGDGFAWKFSNYIHFGFEHYARPDLLGSLLSAYQVFSRDPTEENLAALRWRLRVMANSIEEPVKTFLEQMADGAEAFHRFTDISIFRSSNELHTTTMFASIAYWRQRFPEDFAVIHDASSTFLRNRALWENMTNPDVPEQLSRAGDGSETMFPLRVVSTTAVDSKDSYAVQFCDILAGLSARHFAHKEGPDRAFLDEAIDAGLSSLTYNGIRPQLIFPDQIPPKRLAGPDAVDQLAAIIRGSERRRAKPV